jgi:hypothetical protein
MTAFQQFLTSIGVLIAIAGLGLCTLGFWEDSWALRIASILLSRVEGRRAYRLAQRAEVARREQEFGLPSQRSKELDRMLRMEAPN